MNSSILGLLVTLFERTQLHHILNGCSDLSSCKWTKRVETAGLHNHVFGWEPNPNVTNITMHIWENLTYKKK